MVLTDPEKYSKIIIRAKPGSLNTVFADTKAAWSKLYPTKPFRGYYQDELDAQAANVNESVAVIFRWFALISVLMAATSMFALGFPECAEKIKRNSHQKSSGSRRQAYFPARNERLYLDHSFGGRHWLLWWLFTFKTVDGSDIPYKCRRKFILSCDFIYRRTTDLRNNHRRQGLAGFAHESDGCAEVELKGEVVIGYGYEMWDMSYGI